ncbi:MAG: crossover junction endodeoxyribonuclease RuvC [Eubacteriales bacterium]|nr:crossover junction endodeoxyribonuclease RuvC [Eubacteriales bacterium]
MRILGLDPGYAICGFSLVDSFASQLEAVDFGVFRTTAEQPFEERLLSIYTDLCRTIERYRPDVIAIEELFFSRNTTSAIATAEARGVLVLAAAQYELPLFEYKPMQVKLAVTGYGRADKQQVQEMVRILLGLETRPKPDDAADALAVAICQAHTGLTSTHRLRAAYPKRRDPRREDL